MNHIKGLLIKDFAQLRNYKRNIILMLTFYLIAMAFDTTNEGLSVTSQAMIILVFGIIGITTFNYDESSKTDRYLLTMPLTKKEIVLEKYILSVSTTILGTVLTFIISIILQLLISHSLEGILPLILGVSGGFFGVSLLVSFQIPCIYRWGAERGRIQAMILMSISVGLLATSSILFGKQFIANINIESGSKNLYYWLPILFILLSFIIYFISYLISLKQFQKREV